MRRFNQFLSVPPITLTVLSGRLAKKRSSRWRKRQSIIKSNKILKCFQDGILEKESKDMILEKIALAFDKNIKQTNKFIKSFRKQFNLKQDKEQDFHIPF